MCKGNEVTISLILRHVILFIWGKLTVLLWDTQWGSLGEQGVSAMDTRSPMCAALPERGTR